MYLPKLHTALGVALILSATGTVSLRAQTPAVAGNSSTAVLTSKPKGIEAGNKFLLPTEAGKDEKSEIKRELGNSNTVVGLNSSTDTVRAESSMTAPAQGTASSDNWQFQLTPYLWIVSISGRSGIGNLIIDTDTSVTDTGVELNFGFMSTFEARKNKFVFLTDLQYSDLSTEKGNPGPLFFSTRASFKTFVLDPEVGYRILGKADLAGGGSNFTYQLFGGVGINVGERLALVGGYRDLSVNYNKDGFLFDNSLHGPVLGFGIKF